MTDKNKKGGKKMKTSEIIEVQRRMIKEQQKIIDGYSEIMEQSTEETKKLTNAIKGFNDLAEELNKEIDKK